MKRKLLPFLTLLALLLSACSGPSDSSQSEALSNAYTSAAMTLTTQSGSASPTVTPLETSTPMPTSTAFQIVVTPTGTPSLNPPPNVGGCDNAVYVSDVTIPDGTKLAPGQTFVKTWKLKNTGSCTWSETYSMTFSSGDKMDGSDTEIDQSVAVGDEAEISISLSAPTTEGTYTGYWRLANASGAAFGERVYVQIVVSDDAATNTPTATSTQLTDTPIPTTATLVPTNTPTTAPTSTPAPEVTSTATTGS